MFGNPSLTTRIAIGKTIGLAVGIIGFISMPYFWPEASTMFRWAILLWYVTLGAIVAVFGVYTWNPIFKFSMPWWFMGPWIGAWMNFLLALFIYEDLQAFMLAWPGPDGIITSPFWFSAEGALVGGVIAYLATRFGGEGKECVDEAPPEP